MNSLHDFDFCKSTMEDEAIKCLLEGNGHETSLISSQFLLDLLDDITAHRYTSKYLNIPISSRIFQEQLLPVNGVMQCLFSAGFEEGDDSFYLPSSVAIHHIENFKEKIRHGIQKLKMKNPGYGGAFESRAPTNLHKQTQPNEPTVKLNRSKHVGTFYTQGLDANFQAKINGNANFVLSYEDEELQAKARAVIPVEELKRKARLNQEGCGARTGQIGLRDFLLLELLSWFKGSFFKWVDAEVCSACKIPGISSGTANPTAGELHWGASRVEMFKCPTCNSPIRFPRYNNPGKLLETRKGRCGEWANCFTLCCRALGFEARFVVDWNDHVWTEVYSDLQNRWLHCDPCENVCDKPLLYESGWGKKMTYVMAFSKYEVQDVTWRYSSLHKEVLRRRNLCDESRLLDTITRITVQRQQTLDEAFKKKLLMRKVTELVEFLSPRKPGDENLGGRTSGSLAWRQARGEMQPVTKSSSSYTFTLKGNEIQNKFLHVVYSPVTDTYIRVSDRNREIPGWQSCVYQSSSMLRKVENDWNMVYLARAEFSQKGRISWKFDFTDSNLAIADLQITCHSSTFESGKATCTLSNDIKTVSLQTDNSIIDCHQMKGSTWFLLTVELSGGNGSVAWQHAQLFRLSLNSTNFPFDVKVFLKQLEATSL